MARSLSTLVTTLKNTNQGRTAHLLKIVAGATTFRFTDLPESYSFESATWLPYLLWDAAVRYTRGLEMDGGVVRLSNIDRTLAQNLRDTDFEGATAQLRKFFLEANEAVVIFEGRIFQSEVTENAAEFRLGSEFDPTAMQFPKRDYAALCPWLFPGVDGGFKGDECGYISPPDPGPFTTCPKDFSACTARGRTHRFGGFVHITREVSEVIQDAPAGAYPGGGHDTAPGDWGRTGLELP